MGDPFLTEIPHPPRLAVAPLDRWKIAVPTLLALAAIALVGRGIEGSGGRTASVVAAAAIAHSG